MAAMNNVKIDKFTGRNSFGLWQIKMRALLKQQGLWQGRLKTFGGLKRNIKKGSYHRTDI
ncbi:unnamed protein product [Rhodiola kirilowii]